MVKIKKLTIGHLYPRQMNVYGDMGNIITLRYRLQARGIECDYLPLDSVTGLKHQSADLLIGGGGQDSNQAAVQQDLIKHKRELTARYRDGMPMLVICGMYQLFGNQFVLPDGQTIPGIGIINADTTAGSQRLIGNLVVDSPYGKLVGFENHSGSTQLGPGVEPLGKVLKGFGNTAQATYEGALDHNVFGTYLHGPALAKNPTLSDELLARSLEWRYGLVSSLAPLDDKVELEAARRAARRPR